jgi:hypothetical protein
MAKPISPLSKAAATIQPPPVAAPAPASTSATIGQEVLVALNVATPFLESLVAPGIAPLIQAAPRALAGIINAYQAFIDATPDPVKRDEILSLLKCAAITESGEDILRAERAKLASA